MNSEEKPVVDGAGAGAGAQPEAEAAEVDLLSEFEKALDRAEKAEKERDQWKKVGLAKKRGEPTPEEAATLTEEEVERRAEEKAQQKLAEREADEAAKLSRDIALKALKENRELKVALKNRGGVVTTPSSAGQGDNSPKANETFFSPEQLKHLEELNRRIDPTGKIKLDPQKIKENYLKRTGR